MRPVALLGSAGLGSMCFWNPGLGLKSKHHLGNFVPAKDRSTVKRPEPQKCTKASAQTSYILFVHIALAKTSQMAVPKAHGLEKYFYLKKEIRINVHVWSKFWKKKKKVHTKQRTVFTWGWQWVVETGWDVADRNSRELSPTRQLCILIFVPGKCFFSSESEIYQ